MNLERSCLLLAAAVPGFLVGEFASNAQQATEAFAMGELYRGYVPRSPFSVRDKTLGRRQAALFLPAEYLARCAKITSCVAAATT